MITPRTIPKKELVKMLYPNSISVRSALQQLRNELDECPELKDKLKNAGRLKCHYYNKQQVLLILEHFCISFEELG